MSFPQHVPSHLKATMTFNLKHLQEVLRTGANQNKPLYFTDKLPR